MKFATIGHLDSKDRIHQIPSEWIHDSLIISPEFDLNKTSGYLVALKLTAEEIIKSPRDNIRKNILDAAVYAQNKLNVEVIQLGAFTTSVTKGGIWLTEQREYSGYVNHGDSYTAFITCENVKKILQQKKLVTTDCTLAIVGAYGIIGEAVSKILTPFFKSSLLIGRRPEKLNELTQKLPGLYDTSTSLDRLKDFDVIVTATSHPTALLNKTHLKEGAVIVDVSQPPNLSMNICQKRKDIIRIDGGFVSCPSHYPIQLPGLPPGKIFACVAEVIMQAMENEKNNHVGSIEMNHIHKTETWAKKYGFILEELTNFGKPIN